MIQHDRDRRTSAERRRDATVERAIEAGTFSRLTAGDRRQSRDRARLRKAARASAERLGLAIGDLRRSAGIPQARLAQLIGTQRTDLSRLESGRYGGVTVDRLNALVMAIKEESGMSWTEILGLKRGGPSYAFRSVADTVESADLGQVG